MTSKPQIKIKNYITMVVTLEFDNIVDPQNVAYTVAEHLEDLYDSSTGDMPYLQDIDVKLAEG